MKYVALALAAFFAFIWLYGGIKYSAIGHAQTYYFLGWAVAAAYIPLYWWRTRVEDRRPHNVADMVPAPDAEPYTDATGVATDAASGD
jgi:hypothetical protein